jgi:CRISPR-associated protein Cas2
VLILITYDVNTQTVEGRRRLRQVARTCLNYGQRVQNSVFECELDAAQLVKVKNRLINLINAEKDSLRFYNMGNDLRAYAEHFGIKQSFDITGALII